MSSKLSVFAVSWQQTIPGTTLFKQPLSLVVLLLVSGIWYFRKMERTFADVI
jgi:lipopolysaccharide transport system permease protein